MSEATQLQGRLQHVMAEVGSIGKDKVNSFHGYGYTSAEAVMNKVRRSLVTHGVTLATESELLRFEGGHAVVRVTLHFHFQQEHYSAQGLGQGFDKGDKAVMKAMTAASKYAYATAFCISWGDDPEADSATDRHHNYSDGTGEEL
tara:strand:- start:506 stop:940 length:435 start_codon:yes stop_codon:yes gene_type:complete